MFVQVMRGQVADATEFQDALDRWVAELGPGSTGWQSTTSGVTADGVAVLVVCFDSAEAAQRNAARPEQHQWFMETSKLFAGDVVFHDCTEVMTYGEAPARGAGFVQVMEGRITNLQRLREMSEKVDSVMRRERPDVLGWIAAVHEDGAGCTQAVYFRDEASAREAEGREPSPEAMQVMTETQSLFQVSEYTDLHTPRVVFR